MASASVVTPHHTSQSFACVPKGAESYHHEIKGLPFQYSTAGVLDDGMSFFFHRLLVYWHDFNVSSPLFQKGV